MEIKQYINEIIGANKDGTAKKIVLNNENEERSESEVIEYLLKQAGLYKYDKLNKKVITDFDSQDIRFISYYLNTMKFNPYLGEVSFFKSKSGKVEAMPYYGALFQRLYAKLKAQGWKGDKEYKVIKDENMGICGHIEFKMPDGKIIGEYTLALNDYPEYKGKLQFVKLRKQTILQYIKEDHKDIYCGFDVDEVNAFNLAQGKIAKKENKKEIENVEVKL